MTINNKTRSSGRQFMGLVSWAMVLGGAIISRGEWQSWTPAAEAGHAVDRQTMYQGQPSLKIWQTNEDESVIGNLKDCRWHQSVTVKPGSVYTVCTQAKTLLTEGAVGFEVGFYRSAKPAQAAAFTPEIKYQKLISGTNDWAFIAYTFRTPPWANYATIACRGKAFKGEVWFSPPTILEGETLPIPSAASRPKPDGKINGDEWQPALVCESFVPTDLIPGESPHRNTQCYLAFDSANLYVAALCPEPRVDALRCAGQNDGDAAILQDDGVDVYLSTRPDYDAPSIQLAFNTRGKVFVRQPGQTAGQLRGIKAVASVAGDSYGMEVCIPLADLGIATAAEAQTNDWKIALGRRRFVTGVPELSYWTRPTLEVRHPWIWTAIRPAVSSNTMRVKYDHWVRGDEIKRALPGVKNDHLLATAPLFGELLTDRPRRWAGHSGFVWRFPYEQAAEDIALRFGKSHDREAIMRATGEAGLAIYEYWLGTLDNARYKKNTKSQQALDKSGAKVSYFASYHQLAKQTNLTNSPGCPKGQFKDWQLIFDPAVESLCLADLERTIQANLDRLSSVMFGDEVLVAQLWAWQEFLKAWHKQEIHYPWLDGAMAELKEKYGYGKFGPPLGPDKADANEPFRRVAFKRWFADQSVRVMKNFHDTATRLKPDLLIIGEDISFNYWGRHYPYNRYTPYVDVLSGQIDNYQMKVVSDLIGDVELWPCNHREGWGSANESVAYFSENVLNGARGFDIWPHGGRVEFGDRLIELGTFYWSYRSCWDAHLYIADKLKNMPRLNYPKPDAAILFSNVTDDEDKQYNAMDRALYDYLGPLSGTWFNYISDYQIADRQVDLSAYRTIFVPYARVELPEVLSALRKYVRAGGTLVLCDPEAFAFRTDGTSTAEFRKAVAGVSFHTEGQPVKANRLTITAAGEKWLGYKTGQTLELRAPAVVATLHGVVPEQGVEILAQYADGKPAITRNPYGKGQCFYFSFQPCLPDLTGEREWVFLFRGLARALGMKTNQDIWRFQMPLMPDERPGVRTMDCLTGNYCDFFAHQVIGLDANVNPTGMAYRYSVWPDRIKETGQKDGKAQGTNTEEWIPFSQGRLTDALSNFDPAYCKKAGKREDWVVGYSTGKTFSITVDLQAVCTVAEVDICFQGALPKVSVSGSADNITWVPMGTSKPVVTEYVHIQQITLKSGPARYFRLEAAGTASDLTLAEIQIWGQAAKGMTRRILTSATEKEESILLDAPVRVIYPAAVRNLPQSRLIYLSGLAPKNNPQPGWLPEGQSWSSMNGDVTLLTSRAHDAGLVYKKSLYAQAPTEIVYELPAGVTTFVAAAGLGNNDANASVVFHVLVDGMEKFKSDVYKSGKPVLPVVVDVKGGKELKLVADGAGDGISNDYAWWGEARLIRE